MQWSNEARHLYQAYLDEVKSRCRAQGVWAEPLVSSVEKAVQARLAQAGVEQVTQAVARQVLASLGSPENIVANSNGGAPPPPPLPPATGQATPPPLPARPAPAPGLAAHVARPIPQAAPKAKSGGRGVMILVSLLCVPLVLGVAFLAMLPGIIELQETGEKNGCADNLVTLHGALSAYSQQHGGQFPQLETGQSVPFSFGEKFVNTIDVHWLRCPSVAYDDEEESYILQDPDYIYLGAAIRSQAEMDVFMDAYVASGGEVTEAITPAQVLKADMPGADQIPLLVEYNLYHEPDGAHVLYLDGHIEYLEMNSRFPVTDAFYEAAGQAWGAGTLKSCEENISVLGAQLLAVGERNQGNLPPLATEGEPFLFGGPSVSELDRTRLRCPAMAYEGESVEDILLDSDYIYLGSAVRNAVEMEAYVDAYVGVDGDVARFLALESIAGPQGPLAPLALGLPEPERIPLLIEWSGLHNASGGHVFYLDGHVEFLEYDSQFPMTERFFANVRRATDAVSRPRCENNLQELSKAFVSYSEKAGGSYPRLTQRPDNFLPEDGMLASIEAKLLRCPEGGYEGETDEDIIDDADYLYLGFAVRNQVEMTAYLEARKAVGDDWAAFSGQESIPCPTGDLPSLNSGLPNPGEIPVLVEWWGYHQPSGGHVLYLDGHIEYVERGVKFPMTEEFFDALYSSWQEEPSAWSEFKKGFWEAMEEEYR